MLTIEDLRNPKRPSGYDYVVAFRDGRSRPFGAQIPGKRSHTGRQFQLPNAATAEQAGQMAVDYLNAKPLTIEDIRNPKRKSGFAHVNQHGDVNRVKRYRARRDTRQGGKRMPAWLSQWRKTAEEAAQDYVDHVNGQLPSVPRVVKTADKLRFVRHPRKPTKANPAASTSPKREKEGPGYVYLIGMIGNDAAVKIGESRDHPKFRLQALQTGCAWELYVIAFVKSKQRLKLEASLHRRFAKLQTPTQLVHEWFPKDESIVNYFTPDAGGSGKTTKEVTTA